MNTEHIVEHTVFLWMTNTPCFHACGTHLVSIHVEHTVSSEKKNNRRITYKQCVLRLHALDDSVFLPVCAGLWAENNIAILLTWLCGLQTIFTHQPVALYWKCWCIRQPRDLLTKSKTRKSINEQCWHLFQSNYLQSTKMCGKIENGVFSSNGVLKDLSLVLTSVQTKVSINLN